MFAARPRELSCPRCPSTYWDDPRRSSFHVDISAFPTTAPKVLSRTSSTEAVRPEMRSSCASSTQADTHTPERAVRLMETPRRLSAAPKGRKRRTFAAVSNKSSASGREMASAMSENGRSRTSLSACSGSKVRTAMAVTDAARAACEKTPRLLRLFVEIGLTGMATTGERDRSPRGRAARKAQPLGARGQLADFAAAPTATDRDVFEEHPQKLTNEDASRQSVARTPRVASRVLS
jgi:hypothetical protein